MKVRELKCSNCNASLKIDEKETKGVCEYCHSQFVIDDEKIEINHTGTIEITDDTSLKVAETTLNKFKDYDKSLLLYRRLLLKYAHKREVYIGLVRSITKDFSISSLTIYELEQVNEYFKKYKILSDEDEYSKYEKQINDLNKNYWYALLINKTHDFNPHILGEKVNVIEKYYQNYQAYADKKDNSVKNKINEYLEEYKRFLLNQKNEKKRIIKTILTIIGGILLIFVVLFITDKPRKVKETLNLSEINSHLYQRKNDYQYFKKYFKSNFSNLKIAEINLNYDNKTVDIKIITKNIISKKTKTFNFKVIDDAGPVITPIACSFMDTENIDLNKCFTLYDFTDGQMKNEEATILKDNIDFTEEGVKNITINATDKDGNTSSLIIEITITKTPINLEFVINENLTVGNTYKPSIKITPNNIKDTSVNYTYDKNLLTFENNQFRILKKGTTEICATTNYNKEIRKCKTVNLNLVCKDKYIFSLNASKEVALTADETFCPGTYKIYVDVTNKDNFYHIKIKPLNSNSWKTMTIYKPSDFLNNEGDKYVLDKGDSIVTDIGITKITLIKTK